MLNEQKTDEILKKALSPIKPDQVLNQKLRYEMENKKMKKMNMKKMVISVAAGCLLLGSISVAAIDDIAYIASSSSAFGEKDFSKLDKYEEEVGFSVKALEKFQNEYTFVEMVIDNNSKCDENGNSVMDFKGISFEYEKSGCDSLYISMDKDIYLSRDDERQPDEITVIGDIEVSYYLDTYKWVPVDYELTEEDEENLKKDNYFISDGADEVSENLVSSVSWVQDGIYYNIGNVFGETDADVLFQMAEELIMTEY